MSEADFDRVTQEIATLGRTHRAPPLLETDVTDEPFAQFSRWMEDALGAELLLPNAMGLATATKNGEPSVRMVLLKGFDERGFVFFTSYESRKGRELAENARAALVFYWADLERQVNVSGSVEKVSRAESEEYFRTRPQGSRVGAWASRQSEVIEGRHVLEERMEAARRRFEGREVPLPEHWGGFRLSPDTVEFWQARPDRLHDRLRYRRVHDGWKLERLSP